MFRTEKDPARGSPHGRQRSHGSNVFEELADAIEPIKHPGRGRPRKCPAKLHADKGYDAKKCRKALRKRAIKGYIARKGKESGKRLERHRWVVKRTLAWLARYPEGWRCVTSGGRTSTKRSSTSAVP